MATAMEFRAQELDSSGDVKATLLFKVQRRRLHDAVRVVLPAASMVAFTLHRWPPTAAMQVAQHMEGSRQLALDLAEKDSACRAVLSVPPRRAPQAPRRVTWRVACRSCRDCEGAH